jgi:hypothetical protein
MDLRRHAACMWLLVVIAVLAFFPLALAFGRDSPHDERPRRWI